MVTIRDDWGGKSYTVGFYREGSFTTIATFPNEEKHRACALVNYLNGGDGNALKADLLLNLHTLLNETEGA